MYVCPVPKPLSCLFQKRLKMQSKCAKSNNAPEPPSVMMECERGCTFASAFFVEECVARVGG